MEEVSGSLASFSRLSGIPLPRHLYPAPCRLPRRKPRQGLSRPRVGNLGTRNFAARNFAAAIRLKLPHVLALSSPPAAHRRSKWTGASSPPPNLGSCGWPPALNWLSKHSGLPVRHTGTSSFGQEGLTLKPCVKIDIQYAVFHIPTLSLLIGQRKLGGTAGHVFCPHSRHTSRPHFYVVRISGGVPQ